MEYVTCCNQRLLFYESPVRSETPLCVESTCPPLDKMATILADYKFKCIFLNGYDKIQIQISLKFVPKSPISNRQQAIT